MANIAKLNGCKTGPTDSVQYGGPMTSMDPVCFVTPNGIVHTPAFMPVGTQAAVKAVAPDELRRSGAEIVLANTYHLMLRPGAERIAALGWLHKFMNWPGPILTDSGGFQVMSLSELRRIEEDAVIFRSHIDGDMVTLSPERAVEIQLLLGADISMQLDECIELPKPRAELERAMNLSLRWAQRCKRAFDLAWRAFGDWRTHSSSRLITFERPSASRSSCAVRLALASSHAE